SEDRLFGLGWGTFGIPATFDHPFSVTVHILRWVPVPFVVANEVEDPATDRVWRTYFEFENHNPVRKFNASAIASFETTSAGLLNYADTNDDPGATADPKEAVNFNEGGVLELSQFDDFGQKTAEAVARISSIGEPQDEILLRELEYLPDNEGDRPDLLI